MGVVFRFRLHFQGQLILHETDERSITLSLEAQLSLKPSPPHQGDMTGTV